MKGDAGKCMAAGMDAYVSKPIRPHDLANAIQCVVPVYPRITQAG
jgi:CheY-like chemotaxis protein